MRCLPLAILPILLLSVSPVLGDEDKDAARARQLVEDDKQADEQAKAQVDRALAAVKRTRLWEDFENNKIVCQNVTHLLADPHYLTQIDAQQFAGLRARKVECQKLHNELRKKVEGIVTTLAAEFAKEDLLPPTPAR